ncbi:hypothetical protein [Tissierella pigra]|uniref:hypothetical protein n=1 Tax=Tissierella pigra TaxID=2607614 RepID=UPI0012B2C7EE|nr:hypothetical protein [Tissierella pigra]
MKIDEFLHIMQKVARLKTRLEQENINGQQAEVILKVYINDLTDRINTSMLNEV